MKSCFDCLHQSGIAGMKLSFGFCIDFIYNWIEFYYDYDDWLYD